MSRLIVWACFTLGGFLYWLIVHHGDFEHIHNFAGQFWFGGLTLSIHWLTNLNETITKETK